MSNRQQQTRLKRVTAPPLGLAKLIELVNGLPENPFSVDQMLYEIQKANPNLLAFEVMREVAIRFEAEVARASDQVREYLGPTRDSLGLIIAAESQGRYTGLIVANNVLRSIALFNKSASDIAASMARATNEGARRRIEVSREGMLIYWERLGSGFDPAGLKLDFSNAPQIGLLGVVKQEILIRWNINKRREIKFTISPGFPWVEEVQNVDALRIRECPRCEKVFFAGRMHQLACPKPCAHILRTLRWRDAYNEKYKQQRIEKANAEEAAPERPDRSNRNSRKERT